MDVKIEQSWKVQLSDEFSKQYFLQLTEFVKQEYKSNTIFPPPAQIFNAFEYCPFEKVKVVILGQDPYHGKGQAHGLAFSVNERIALPPSLQNIYKEIKSDTGEEPLPNGSLISWAKQGVLLLNATLTVQISKPGSHQNKGWEQFTDAVIKLLSDKKHHLVFILWGAYARKKRDLIDDSKHLILESAHPSPFSAAHGFFGNRHFSKTNHYLEENGVTPITWGKSEYL